MFLQLFRIGEAKVPGPPQNNEQSWRIGVCNPSGLPSKYHILSSVPADILAISETHLTAASTRALKGSLKAMRSPFTHVITGAPLAPRTVTSDAGQYAGVAFTTMCPSRTLSVPWPLDAYETSRIQFLSACLDHNWVTGAVIYGYPTGKTHHDAHARTEAILDFASDHMLMLPGERFLCGDWNYEPHELSVTAKLSAAGWVEVQTWRLQRMGAAIEPTCKGKTQKDVLWVSPELAMKLQDVSLSHDTFADHAVLFASFERTGGPSIRYLWPRPGTVPWDQVPDLDEPIEFAHPLDPTQQFATLWSLREQQAKQTLGHAWSPAMAGRGRQTKPKKCVSVGSPPKTSRSHEVQPAFHGFSLVHARWFKQLRRLQNYCRWIENEHGRAVLSDGLHGIALWHSILTAPGFVPNFCSWWLQRQYRHPDDPACVPPCRPTAPVARRMFDTMLAEVRLLETRLHAAKAARRRHQHEEDPNLIFKDVARDSPEPVETLLQSTTAKVTYVDESESAVVFDQPVDLDSSTPVWIAGAPVSVIHADHDKLWIESVDGILPNDQMVQTQPIGSLDAIFDAFHAQWAARWCKHDNIPNSQWADIVNFAKRVIKPCSVPVLQLDASVVVAELSRKKKTAATGLDGVCRIDMQCLGPQALASYLNMYKRAESDGTWPAQITAGKVYSLAKVAGAARPDQFRPITIFSLAYRLWSSIQARHLLRHAEDWVHSGVYGSRRQTQAAHLWSKLNNEIETAYATNQPLAGLSADLVKCFNTIPRWPTLVIAILAGTPEPITTAWAGALQSMVRHFKVRDSYSAGFPTSTGLAEGCGLSVFGMLLIDHVFHVWVQCHTPAIRSLSFVDDWHLLTRDPEWACRQLDVVLQFAAMVDLTVDVNKTYAWATDAATRATLRTTGVTVLHHARQLGGHLSMSRQYTNSTLQARIQALDDFWKKLRTSRCSLSGKIRAIKTVAWPRGLHAVSSAPLGDNMWTFLRRRVKAALSLDKAGVNSFLLGLTDFLLDPQYVAVINTLKDVRTFQSLDFWAAVVSPCATGHLDLPPNSPAQVVLQRIQQLGFTVTSEGMLRDQIGTFCPMRASFAEVELRVQHAWCQVVAAKIGHRNEFDGLVNVDFNAVKRALASLSISDRALYRLCLSGGFVTEDVKSKWSSRDDVCRWCGQPDSLRHRIWECPKFTYLRTQIAPDALAALPQLPPALALRGWAMRSPTWVPWLALLDALPLELPRPPVDFAHGRWNDVFTDGSCFWQDQPGYRVAAWAAVLAQPCSSTWKGQTAGVISSGPLPGISQTAFRAELFAVAVALHWASVSRVRVRLWLDCLGVVNKLVLILLGVWSVSPNQPHADLWNWIASSVSDLGVHNVRVIKVPAHRSLDSATSRLDWWKIYNNDAADRAARLANQGRSEVFWQCWMQHVRGVVAAEKLSAQVRDLHVAIARQQVQTAGKDPVVPTQTSTKMTRQFEQQFDDAEWKGQCLPNLARMYGRSHAVRVTKWWTCRTQDNQANQTCWISFAQLFIDFCMSFGQPGPVKIQGQWIDVASRPYVSHDDINLRVKLRWFRRFVQNMLREGKVKANFAQCRPDSCAIQAHVQCISVRWSTWHKERVDLWLLQNLNGPCTRNADALLTLPSICQDEAMRVDVSH